MGDETTEAMRRLARAGDQTAQAALVAERNLAALKVACSALTQLAEGPSYVVREVATEALKNVLRELNR